MGVCQKAKTKLLAVLPTMLLPHPPPIALRVSMCLSGFRSPSGM